MDVEQATLKHVLSFTNQLKAGSGSPVLFGPVLNNSRVENIKRL